MTSLFIHAALGAVTVAVFFYANAHLYRRWPGSQVTVIEGLCYALAVGSVCVGWYFNTQYVLEYPAEQSWIHFTMMLFTNPASASIGQDIIVTNALLFPLWTIVDGSRRGLRMTWIYFVMSLLAMMFSGNFRSKAMNKFTA